MRTITIAGVSALALALSGCGMFGSHNNEQGTYTSPSYSAASSPQTAAAGGNDYGTGQSYRHRRASAQLRRAQQTLQADGYYNGQIDGIYGPQTRDALTAYQKAQGIEQSGRLDQQTMASLQDQENGNNGSTATGSNNGGPNPNNSGTASGSTAPTSQATAPSGSNGSNPTGTPSGTSTNPNGSNNNNNGPTTTPGALPMK